MAVQAQENTMLRVLSIESEPNAAELLLKPHERFIRHVLQGLQSDDKVFCVSICGPQGKGKSFFVNMMASYLGYKEETGSEDYDDWLESEQQISGAEYKKQRNSTTRGIWIWHRPFIITVPSTKSKIAVLLMDCQGLGDHDDNIENIDANLTMCITELSHLTILNFKEDFDALHLRHLADCIRIDEAHHPQSTADNYFKMLLFLHRDCDVEENWGFHGDYFTQKESCGNVLTEDEKKIQSKFGQCPEYMLPKPGRRVYRADSSNPVMLQEIVREEESSMFLYFVGGLFEGIFQMHPAEYDRLPTKNSILHAFQRISERLTNGENLEPIVSSEQQRQIAKVQDFKDQLNDELRTTFDLAIRVSDYPSEYALRAQFDQVVYRIETAVQRTKTSLYGEGVEIPRATRRVWQTVDACVSNWKVARWKSKLAQFREYQQYSVMQQERYRQQEQQARQEAQKEIQRKINKFRKKSIIGGLVLIAIVIGGVTIYVYQPALWAWLFGGKKVVKAVKLGAAAAALAFSLGIGDTEDE